jgi:hypothetical protein
MMQPAGPPPSSLTVSEAPGFFSVLPIIEAAASVLPRAAVTTGVDLWISRARSVISLEFITDIETYPSLEMALISSSIFTVFASAPSVHDFPTALSIFRFPAQLIENDLISAFSILKASVDAADRRTRRACLIQYSIVYMSIVQ